MTTDGSANAERQRLGESERRERNWKRWGPYLAERQWGTVREDYSAGGTPWDYFPRDHARSRAYRWGEDGLLGWTDRECRLCFALALWNDQDPILKERLFGLTNAEGNHGEDVKEQYFYLDASPTHAYARALYKYPQAEFPYQELLEENTRRGRDEPEFELLDTGVFDENRYWDLFVEYAKQSPNDILIRLTAANRGPEAARLHLLPTLWFRNTWAWGCRHEGCWPKPRIEQAGENRLLTEHVTLGRFDLIADVGPNGEPPAFLFTENETNARRLFDAENAAPAVKDAFHDYVVNGVEDAVSLRPAGTKAAAHYVLDVPAGAEVTVRLRLFDIEDAPDEPFGQPFQAVFAQRRRETGAFYDALLPSNLTADERHIARQAYAGLLWTKQFYHYVVEEWLAGDPEMPPPPAERRDGVNADWTHLFARDVLSVPDAWEYPWFAAWDLAFHMVPFAQLDPAFAKKQLLRLLREWYMHPNGQMPAYEFGFSDVNPPVHAWACWRVYKIAEANGQRDIEFLARTFQKLMLNFTWWVNRKDAEGRHVFSGGFLGLDNIGVFDRSKPLPTGGRLDQADGTAWMAFYCATMLAMALELALHDPVYEDVASKFFEHFVHIADAMNALGGTGLWDEADGFYYDQLLLDGENRPLRTRSLVGLLPLIAVTVLEQDTVDRLPDFKKRMEWFLENRQDLARHISYLEVRQDEAEPHAHRLLAIPSRERLGRVVRYMLDEGEFLSPYGLRSLSAVHREQPFRMEVGGQEYVVRYDPGESSTTQFGGNSNWRGPVWFPVNYLIVEALERYHHFYGDTVLVEFPTGSGRMMHLGEVAAELGDRLCRLFARGEDGVRPCCRDLAPFRDDPHWRDLVLFHEYFHGDTGRGLGASHQTGWTALVTRLVEDCARRRAEAGAG